METWLVTKFRHINSKIHKYLHKSIQMAEHDILDLHMGVIFCCYIITDAFMCKKHVVL